jgi:hypothetical protein
MLDPNKAVVGDPVPQILRRWLQTLRPCFTAPSWEHVLVLVMGALLAPGKRTVTSCLRMTGRAGAANFATSSGLRWLSFMVLTPVSWTSLIKALPVLTLLAPSERSNRHRGCRHKLLTDWARQGALQLSRWLPGRRIIFIGDSSFAVHELAHAIYRRATLISRLRLDASLFAPPSKRTSQTRGRPAQKGPALPKLKTLLSNPATSWTRIIVSAWYGHAGGKTLEITSAGSGGAGAGVP